MHQYRTHNCNQLNESHINQKVKLSGWVYRRRDHGSICFIDLRDHYGVTQIVASDSEQFEIFSKLNFETVITVIGTVVARSEDTINDSIATGKVEVVLESLQVESTAELLPINVNNNELHFPEELRLKYRFLDLRRENLHSNIVLRSNIISHLRESMQQLGFMEFQTPILTASSPEGARDFLVPSRLNPGKFYALPQAPQQFKQLLMVSGFDKYFQIAPCFRDEDARADRSPGEFYQLDIEMSFATQEDVFAVIEPVLFSTFQKFSEFTVTEPPFPRITYADAMLKYGTDKPDLRNPLEICDVTEIFADADFTTFRQAIKNNSVVRAISAPNVAKLSRSFFDKLIDFAKTELSAKGLAYICFNEDGSAKGPVAKFLTADKLQQIKSIVNLNGHDSIFFICEPLASAVKIASRIRNKLGEDLNLIAQNEYKFCWIVDFPYFDWNYDTKKIEFSHNPFSMPQGGMEALEAADTVEKQLAIRAFQYDIVVNGIELSSGAIRNHKPEIMYKAFGMAGISQEEVDSHFGGLINALKFGAPPHGGLAPGVDRIVMLIANEQNIREVICFPLNQSAQDLLMDAPSTVTPEQLKSLHIKLDLPPEKK
jgi:aspartyl-tRNA synthetase